MKHTRAFTLIEMIVALAIFSVVAVVALGALIKIVSANKKAQSLQSAMTNINFALESISREMRVGSNYSCKQALSPVSSADGVNNDLCKPFVVDTPPSSTDGIIVFFKSSKVDNSNAAQPCNLIYAYSFDYRNDGSGSWDIKKAAQNNCVDPLLYNDTTYASIIDRNVIITSLYINISKDTYPLAAIRISGYVGGNEKEKTYFDVQTAVSARVPSGQ